MKHIKHVTVAKANVIEDAQGLFEDFVAAIEEAFNALVNGLKGLLSL